MCNEACSAEHNRKIQEKWKKTREKLLHKMPENEAEAETEVCLVKLN